MVEGQCISRSLEYKDKPVASIDQALVQNYQKGIVAGMRLALRQPAAVAEILQEQFNAKLAEERANVSN